MYGRKVVGLVLVAVCGISAGAALGAEEEYAVLYEKMVKDSEAQQKMLDGGMEAAKYLAGRLIENADSKAVAALVKQLDDDNFKVRNKAQEELLNLGKPAQKLVEAALEGELSVEARERLQGVLERLKVSKGLGAEEDARQKLAVKIIGMQGAKGVPLLKEVKEKAIWESTRREATKVLAVEERRGVALELEAAIAGGKVDEVKVAAVMERVTAAGMERDPMVKYQLTRVEAMRAAEKERAGLEEKLKADPKDAAARTALVKLLVVELVNPAEAKKVAEGGEVDAGWKATAELLARDRKGMKGDELVKVAEELRKLAATAGPAGKLRLLQQSMEVYIGIVSGEVKGVAPGTEEAMKQTMAAVSDEISRVKVGAGALEAKDLVAGVDLKTDVLAGEWVKGKDGLLLKSSDFGVVNVPTKLPEDYELTVTLTRKDGTDGVYVAFPVGTSRANLNLGGWGNTVCGIETIGGVAANDHESDELRRLSGLENSKAYTYVITVNVNKEEATVVVTENGKAFVKWSGEVSAISGHATWKPGEQTGVGLGAHRSEVLFEKVTVKTLGGGGK